MRYLLDDGLMKNVISMEHQGEVITWSIKTYRSLVVNKNLITDINHYWSLLPMESQTEIFRIYKSIYNAFEEIELVKRLDIRLTELVSQLFEYHKFEDIVDYYNKHSKIKLPSTLKDTYASRHTRELTYLRHEYYELVCLTIVMKVMIPVWGSYVGEIGSETGSYYKEYRAAGLLRDANVVKSHAYERLMEYITTYWNGNTDAHSSAAIVAGLDDNQVPNWLMGNVLVRHIATGELIQLDNPIEPQIIITSIFNYIDHLSKTMDKQFGGQIREKGLENQPGDDDNTSVAENYKIKQEISEGIIVAHEVHLMTKLESILNRLDSTCPVEKLQETIDNFNNNFKGNFVVYPLQLAITQWVLDPIVTARILKYVKFEALINAYHVAYTLLQHWGYKHVAILMYAQQTRTNVMSNVVRRQVTDEQLDKLVELYPYAQNSTLKRKPSKRDSNVAAAAIKYLVVPLYQSWWRVAPWESQSDYPTLNIVDDITSLPFDLEPVLADMIIFLKTVVHVGKYSIVEIPKPTL